MATDKSGGGRSGRGSGGGGGIKSKLIGYAAKKNKGTGLTNEEFIGKAASGGVAISRTPNSRIVVKVARSGKTITLTETKITRTQTVANGRVTFGETSKTKVILSGDV